MPRCGCGAFCGVILAGLFVAPGCGGGGLNGAQRVQPLTQFRHHLGVLLLECVVAGRRTAHGFLDNRVNAALAVG